jgi:hypothetical protein
VTLGQVLLRVLRVSPVCIIPPMLRSHLHLNVFLTKRTNGGRLETLQKKKCFFGNHRALDRDELSLGTSKVQIWNTELFCGVWKHNDNRWQPDKNYTEMYRLCAAHITVLLRIILQGDMSLRLEGFKAVTKDITVFTVGSSQDKFARVLGSEETYQLFWSSFFFLSHLKGTCRSREKCMVSSDLIFQNL